MTGVLGATLVASVAARQAAALTSPITKGSLTIKLTNAATINTGTDGTPQDIASPNDGSGRIFIATRNGDIRILSGGSISSTPFLDESNAGYSIFTGGEGGLLGLAFDPNYATNGKFYTLQTETFSISNPAADYSSPEDYPTTSTNPANQIVLRQWTVSGDPNVANTTSIDLLRINHPESNHQGGSLRFGPDGNLYLGLGDGGGGNDFNGSVTSMTDGHNNTIGNAQDKTVPFGKILRINPNPAAGAGFTVSTNGKYSIPNTNPFISGSGGSLKEIYAYGLRNPFRINFDSSTGTMYAADVGQSNREEVDQITNGGNYGWVFLEGTRDNSGTNGAGRTTPMGFTSIPPIAEYTHSDGDAIIGGEVFRGTGFSSLVGNYVFGDLAGTTGSIGRMFYTPAAGGTISEFNYDSSGLTPTTNIYGVVAGPNQELYALFSDGSIDRITAGIFTTRWNISTGGSWGTTGSWSNGLPTPQASHANFLASPGITTASTVTLDGNRTVGQITFTNPNGYTISQGSSGTLTIDDSNDAGGVNPLINVTSGSHTISAPISLANGITITTAGGTSLTISGAVSGSGTVTVNGSGTFAFAGAGSGSTVARALSALVIAPGATTLVNTSSSGGLVVLHPTTLTFQNASTSKLNLTNNELLTTNDLNIIRSEINHQIFTTTGGGTLGSLDIGGGTIKVRFTLFGDTDVDGRVNVQDLANLAANFGKTAGATWIQGDFDYDGIVNTVDLSDLAGNFGQSLSGFVPAALPADVAASEVPEPAIGLATIGGAILLVPRRRIRHGRHRRCSR
jgi:glucose/arabinose dehydrogenase